MGFLDGDPDLAGTIITKDNLTGARNYLIRLISRLDPKWLEKPKGHLRLNWIINGQGPVTYLVDLAFHWATAEQALTDRSRPIFESKVKEFLKTENDQEAENLLAEFQILSAFGRKIKPIELDPLVDPKDLLAPDRPKTPDFSFQAEAGTVWAEITVLYFEPLIRWKSNIKQMFSYFDQVLSKILIRRIIEFSLPLKFAWAEAREWGQSELMPQIIAKESGKISTAITNNKIEVVWKPLPHINVDFSQHPDPKTIQFPNSKYATWPGPDGLGIMLIGDTPNYSMMAVKRQSGIALEAAIQAEDATEMIIKSLRNTLDRKRQQLKSDETQIIISKIAHPELTFPEMIGMINDRIWPNPAYKWLTGIVIYNPRRGFTPKDKPDFVALTINPKAACSGEPFKKFMDMTFGVSS